MSFLSRLSARARPPAWAAPLLMPKGVVGRAPAAVHREESAAEEQDIAPKRAMRTRALRRQQTSAPEEGDAELPRAASPEQSEEKPADKVRPLRRAADTQAEPEETEGDVRPVRRAAAETEAAEPDDEARALRRAAAPEADSESEEAEAVQPARLIRRAEEVPLGDAETPLRQPFLSDLDPGAVPSHPDLAGEEEPSGLQALRRDATAQRPSLGESGETGGGAHGSLPAGDVSPFIPGFQDRSGGIGSPAYFDTVIEPRGNPGARAEPSPVIIDQLDVVIHEPVPSPSAARTVADQGRMLRARYLRRL